MRRERVSQGKYWIKLHPGKKNRLPKNRWCTNLLKIDCLSLDKSNMLARMWILPRTKFKMKNVSIRQSFFGDMNESSAKWNCFNISVATKHSIGRCEMKKEKEEGEERIVNIIVNQSVFRLATWQKNHFLFWRDTFKHSCTRIGFI